MAAASYETTPRPQPVFSALLLTVKRQWKKIQLRPMNV